MLLVYSIHLHLKHASKFPFRSKDVSQCAIICCRVPFERMLSLWLDREASSSLLSFVRI